MGISGEISFLPSLGNVPLFLPSFLFPPYYLLTTPVPGVGDIQIKLRQVPALTLQWRKQKIKKKQLIESKFFGMTH